MHSEQLAKRSSTAVKELIANQITGLRNALEIAAQTHLITSLLSEAAVAKDSGLARADPGPFQSGLDAIVEGLEKLVGGRAA
jgi:hypothetical protein